MLPTNIIQVGGAAAILAGLLRGVAAFVPNTTSGVKVLYLFTDIAILLAILGLHALLRTAINPWERAGFRLSLLGVGILLINDLLPPALNLYAVGALIFAIGLCLLAVAAWNDQQLRRWIPAGWVLSTLIGIVGFFAPGLNWLFVLSGVLFGLSFVGAGVEMWSHSIRIAKCRS